MPTNKKRKVKLAPRVVVTKVLSETARRTIGLTLLGIKDGNARLAATLDLEKIVSRHATELANINQVLLQSDMRAEAIPLLKAYKKLLESLERTSPTALSFFEFVGAPSSFTSLLPLIDQGIASLTEVKEKQSLRGGERRSAFRGLNAPLTFTLDRWIERHLPKEAVLPKGKRRKIYAAVGMEIERALYAANKGQKLPVSNVK